MSSQYQSSKKVEFEDSPTLPIPASAFANDELKHKTGSEILKMLNVDFVNSDIAKGISDMEVSYVPDFGYKEIIQFGESQQRSGWKVLLECIQKIPR